MRIDHCVCTQRTFAELLDRAREQGWDQADLEAATGAGGQCGLCRPYLRCGLRTGQAVFHQIIVADADQAESGSI